MAAEIENETADRSLRASDRVHIADIDDHNVGTDTSYIEAFVLLVWPYSSSTKEVSLLLAEKGVALLKTKGQVKVTFRNGCGKEVARSKVGIGDTVKLSLRNSQAVEEQDEVSTPGKKAGFTLLYNGAVEIEITSSNGDRHAINYSPPPPTPSPLQNGHSADVDSPQPARMQGLSPSLFTPSHKPVLRLSSNSFPDLDLDVFADDDGSVAGKGRKRTKFNRRSDAWRLVDDDENEIRRTTNGVVSPEGPEGEQSTMVFVDLTEDDAPEVTIPPEPRVSTSPGEALEKHRVHTELVPTDADEQITDVEPVTIPITEEPVTPQRTSHSAQPLSTSPVERRLFVERPSLGSDRMPTPRLQALASPGLPIVSPLASRQQYFPTFGSPMSELDASSQALQEAQFSPVVADSDIDIETPQTAQEHIIATPIARDQVATGSSELDTRPAATDVSVIDLDDLEQNIMNDHNADVSFGTANNVLEDEDMYGPPIQSTNLVEQESEESIDLVPFKHVSAPAEESELLELTSPGQVEHATPEPETRTPASFDGTSEEGSRIRFMQLSDQVFTPLVPAWASEATGSSNSGPLPITGDSEAAIQALAGNDIGQEILGMQPRPGPAAMFTPQPTQVDDTTEQESVEVQSKPRQELPPTPLDSQELILMHPEGQEQQLTFDLVPPQTPGVTTRPLRRSSRRQLDRPRMSDGVYSAYFTPRKSIPPEKEISISTQSHIEPPAQADVAAVLAATDRQSEIALEPELMQFLDNAQAVTTTEESERQGILTSHGYYVRLNYLGQYFNQLVDVLAVCTADSSEPERAKSGPKDFHITFTLADDSLPREENLMTVSQIFRPRKHVIPRAKRGDVILLRNFKVQTLARKPMLLSTDESAWVVYHPQNDVPVQAASLTATMSGPPVECGGEEQKLVGGILRWWQSEGATRYTMPSVPSRSQDQAQTSTDTVGVRRRIPASPPPPLDLRRSPRQTRNSSSINENIRSPSLASPTFQLTSPTFSQGTADQSMPPPSASIASIASPTSPDRMTTRSSGSASAFGTQNRESKGKARTMSTASPGLDRPRTRSFTQRQVESSNATHSAHSESPDPLQKGEELPQQKGSLHTPPPRRDSIVTMASTSGETDSSRRHRHERRSTSLIHELRDGTQYVDIETSEIVSVSTDDGMGELGENEADTGPSDQGAGDHIPDLPSSTAIKTPSRATRSQSKKSPERVTEPPVSSPQTRKVKQASADNPDDPVPTVRVTRSKAHNIHELRDGTRYEDQK